MAGPSVLCQRYIGTFAFDCGCGCDCDCEREFRERFAVAGPVVSRKH